MNNPDQTPNSSADGSASRSSTGQVVSAPQVIALGKNGSITADDNTISLQIGKTSLVLGADGTIKINGKDIRIVATRDVTIKGAKVSTS